MAIVRYGLFSSDTNRPLAKIRYRTIGISFPRISLPRIRLARVTRSFVKTALGSRRSGSNVGLLKGALHSRKNKGCVVAGAVRIIVDTEWNYENYYISIGLWNTQNNKIYRTIVFSTHEHGCLKPASYCRRFAVRTAHVYYRKNIIIENLHDGFSHIYFRGNVCTVSSLLSR